MPDEAGYISHLVSYEDADQQLDGVERYVLAVAFGQWLRSTEIDEQIRAAEAQQGEEGQE
jgi:hypothetical protein